MSLVLTGMNKVWLLVVLLLYGKFGAAQTITILGSPPTIQMQTASDIQNGKSTTHTSIRIGYPLLNLSGLSLDVFARAEFAILSSTGSGTIPANKIALSVTNLSGADPEILLTTTNQRILHQTPGLLTALLGGTADVSLKYRVLGGSHLLVPAAIYTVRIFYTVSMD